MTDLTDFLLARIAEDEGRAMNAGPKRPWEWRGVGEHGYPQQVIAIGPAVLIAETYTSPDAPGVDAEHIAAWHPARVLAECEAKRRIVATALEYGDPDDTHDTGNWAFFVTLRALALPYADHPDYREEWKP